MAKAQEKIILIIHLEEIVSILVFWDRIVPENMGALTVWAREGRNS